MGVDERLLEVVDSIGEFVSYWGFRRVHGRVWGLVYLTATPPTSPEIARRLDISKGMTSLAITELIEHGLIRKGPKGPHGAQSYVAESDIAKVVRQVLATRERVMLQRAIDGMQSLANETTCPPGSELIANDRLLMLHDLTSSCSSVLDMVINTDMATIPDWLALLRTLIQFRGQGRGLP